MSNGFSVEIVIELGHRVIRKRLIASLDTINEVGIVLSPVRWLNTEGQTGKMIGTQVSIGRRLIVVGDLEEPIVVPDREVGVIFQTLKWGELQ